MAGKKREPGERPHLRRVHAPEDAPAPGDQAENGAPRGEPFNILFVCTGNTCRSPMAEGIARDELARRGWTQVRVASAGVAARRGTPASEEALEVARRHRIDLGGHRSQPLTAELVDWADVILGMGPSHVAGIARAGAGGKCAVLGDFAGAGGGVSDPFGGTIEVYERTFLELRDLIGAALDRLSPILNP